MRKIIKGTRLRHATGKEGKIGGRRSVGRGGRLRREIERREREDRWIILGEREGKVGKNDRQVREGGKGISGEGLVRK